MRATHIKWLVGIVTFGLPALVAIAGKCLDQSSCRHAPIYQALIAIVGWAAIILPLVVPAVLIMRTGLSRKWRFGLTAGVWSLVLVEFYLIFFYIVAARC